MRSLLGLAVGIGVALRGGLLGLAGGVAGQREEGVVERRAAQRHLVDRDPGLGDGVGHASEVGDLVRRGHGHRALLVERGDLEALAEERHEADERLAVRGDDIDPLLADP
jgi:hypothetical protein